MDNLVEEALELLRLLISIEARPGDKLVSDAGDPPIIGYFQTLGVTAVDRSELEAMVRQHVKEDLGGELLGIEEEWSPDFNGADFDIKDKVLDTTKSGIWYRSGRAFYGPEE
ncbi:MAG: hypothetical protein NW208_11665 [Bryobacter sp.]|nr:hypothetical protein [Bryobacter sp.]